MAYIFEVK